MVHQTFEPNGMGLWILYKKMVNAVPQNSRRLVGVQPMCPPTRNFLSGIVHETPISRRNGVKGGWLIMASGKHVTLTHSILPFAVDLGEPVRRSSELAHFGDMSHSEQLTGATRFAHL